jgi:hypothetical protein
VREGVSNKGGLPYGRGIGRPDERPAMARDTRAMAAGTARGTGGRVVILRVHDPRRGLSLKEKETTVRELEEG